MLLKLGKTPARPGAVSFKFGAFFDRRKLPTPPRRFGHEKIGQPWGMFANDERSCCVFAGGAHETMVWRHEGGAQVQFNDDDVLADYAAVTGFDPAKPETDQGTDMVQAASYRRKTGLVDAAGVRHKIESYVALKTGDVDDLALATYLTGATGVGLRFPDSAWDQFDAQQRWTVINGAKASGGHYVPCIGRNSAGDFMVITWGRIQAMSPEFYSKYSDEALAYVSLETMRGNVTPEGFDAASLTKAIAGLASA